MFEKINKYFASKKNLKLIDEISNKYLNKTNQLKDEVSLLSRDELLNKIEGIKKDIELNKN